MPRTRSVAWSELKLGVVGVVALVLVAMIIVAVGGQGGFFWEQYPLKTRFSQVNGLKKGAVVRLNGKEVGKVTSVEFAGPQIEVVMKVSDHVRPLITTESESSVGSLSLLGEPIIDITAATSGTPLADWAYVRANQPRGLSGLTAAASQSLDQLNSLVGGLNAGRGSLGKLVKDEELYDELRQFTTSAANVAKYLDEGKGTLGQLAKDPAAYNALKTSLENLQAITTKISSGQGALGRLMNDDQMGKSLSSAASNLEQVTGRLNRGEGTAGKLLTDQQLYDRFTSIAARMDQNVSGLEAGRGTAGQLLHDQKLYETMNGAATELQALIAEIRKDPKKFLRVTVSILSFGK
jgi:phospholipid/cholesterol/gamma-HCH transport system substrate-binding protein